MVLRSRVTPPDWSADGDEERDARCRHFPVPTANDPNVDTDPFFCDEEEASHICNGTYDGNVCRFRDRCLYGALVNNECAGTWGGLLTIQRRWVRREIDRDEWAYPSLWRDEVPDLAYFEEDQDGPEEQ